jgi:hypothetical protein
MDFQIGIVVVPLLVVGITQGVKNLFGIEGKANAFIAFGAGFVLMALEHGITGGLISPEVTVYIEWFIKSLAGGLAAIGVYDFGKRGVGVIRGTNAN